MKFLNQIKTLSLLLIITASITKLQASEPTADLSKEYLQMKIAQMKQDKKDQRKYEREREKARIQQDTKQTIYAEQRQDDLQQMTKDMVFKLQRTTGKKIQDLREKTYDLQKRLTHTNKVAFVGFLLAYVTTIVSGATALKVFCPECPLLK